MTPLEEYQNKIRFYYKKIDEYNDKIRIIKNLTTKEGRKEGGQSKVLPKGWT